MLGLHLYLEHGLTDPGAFDEHMKFGILDLVSPQDISSKKMAIWPHHPHPHPSPSIPIPKHPHCYFC